MMEPIKVYSYDKELLRPGSASYYSGHCVHHVGNGFLCNRQRPCPRTVYVMERDGKRVAACGLAVLEFWFRPIQWVDCPPDYEAIGIATVVQQLKKLGYSDGEIARSMRLTSFRVKALLHWQQTSINIAHL